MLLTGTVHRADTYIRFIFHWSPKEGEQMLAKWYIEGSVGHFWDRAFNARLKSEQRSRLRYRWGKGRWLGLDSSIAQKGWRIGKAAVKLPARVSTRWPSGSYWQVRERCQAEISSSDTKLARYECCQRGLWGRTLTHCSCSSAPHPFGSTLNHLNMI
jgi:hypothetical protein